MYSAFGVVHYLDQPLHSIYINNEFFLHTITPTCFDPFASSLYINSYILNNNNNNNKYIIIIIIIIIIITLNHNYRHIFTKCLCESGE